MTNFRMPPDFKNNSTINISIWDNSSDYPTSTDAGIDKSIADRVALLNYIAAKELVGLISEVKQLFKEPPIQKSAKDSFNLPEAAEYLGIGKSTLRKALSDGEIIGDRVGRKWRFTQAQLDKYIRRGKSQAEIDAEVEQAILTNKRKRK